MALDKPYLDVPGTTIFDADQSRRGYWLNQFCMSLMKTGNRARFKADEDAYLAEWPMSDEQRAAVRARDLNWMMRTGGNIYFLSKLGATDGLSFQQMVQLDIYYIENWSLWLDLKIILKTLPALFMREQRGNN